MIREADARWYDPFCYDTGDDWGAPVVQAPIVTGLSDEEDAKRFLAKTFDPNMQFCANCEEYYNKPKLVYCPRCERGLSPPDTPPIPIRWKYR